MKISVIIPVYNCEKYITKSLEILIRQINDKENEIILVNDGSTDRTADILEKYEKEYKFIHIISKKNGGVSAARNDGIKKANGKYITFIDCDDYVSNNYFSKINEMINNNPNYDLYCFGMYSEVEGKNGKIVGQDKIYFKELWLKNRDEIKNKLVELYDKTVLYNPVNKIYILDIIKKNNIEFPKYNWGEDIEFNRKYLMKINNLYNSNSCLYHYVRERTDAITNKYKSDFFEIRKKEFYEFNEYFELWNLDRDDYYEFSCRRYIERIFGCIENELCSSLSLVNKYRNIKNMVNDKLTVKTVKYVIPHSTKMKIMIIPLRFRQSWILMGIGGFIHFIKKKNPAIFNKLKNKR